MSLRAGGLGLAALGLLLGSLPSCSGKLIRLGDDTTQAVISGGTMAGGGESGKPTGGAGGALPSGGSPVGAGGDEAGAGGSGAICEHGQVAANEVLWIGDSWIIDPGTQRSTVRDLARAAGTIGDNEEYPSSAMAAAPMSQIAQQYDARESGTPKVKVLLMDGGTWDPIAAQMAGTSIPDAIDTSIQTFVQFLAKVASDGTVEHIVYFLVPELMNIPGVAEMRPRLRQACESSSVPCHFIDLQDVWRQGDLKKLTAINGFQASPDGGIAIGQAVWATMRSSCIAQ